jgi:hypothetical protein
VREFVEFVGTPYEDDNGSCVAYPSTTSDLRLVPGAEVDLESLEELQVELR